MGWLITLGILVLLAILPLGAAVRYNADGLGLQVIAGPVRIPILPAKKKDPDQDAEDKKKKKKKKSSSSQNKQVSKKKKEKGGPLTDFLPLV